jgi:hypothetical protein
MQNQCFQLMSPEMRRGAMHPDVGFVYSRCAWIIQLFQLVNGENAAHVTIDLYLLLFFWKFLSNKTAFIESLQHVQAAV